MAKQKTQRRKRRRLRPRMSADTCQMVKRAIQYVGKGIADGAYTTTVGGDRVPTQLLDHMERFVAKNCR